MTTFAIDTRAEVVENRLGELVPRLGLRFVIDGDVDNALVTSLTEAEAEAFLLTFKNTLREARSDAAIQKVRRALGNGDSGGDDGNVAGTDSPTEDSAG